MSTTIRHATHDDLPQLAALGAATFKETFGHLYSAKDLQAFLEGSRSVASYAKKLKDPRTAIWLAFENEVPVGYAVAGACKLPVENLEPEAGELYELYVLADRQGLKLGTQLLQVVFAWLDAQRFHPLYIGVWSENPGAQRLYARHGFSKVGEYGFPVGDHIDLEFILKRA